MIGHGDNFESRGVIPDALGHDSNPFFTAHGDAQRIFVIDVLSQTEAHIRFREKPACIRKLSIGAGRAERIYGGHEVKRLRFSR